ncbi:MAG: ABC transporter permease [Rhodobacteraceae bacterium]|jgi:spermidine/putrescine transport system permease protein|uniref:ABC transporter permease n=1 Tax=Albidovulum sp. TaxID=1872424 RepID=UPI002659C7BF|nr:ABC transporter permease [uncultured Defluviimonas sp.]MCC0069603.1 ABC transporter permease [Paracoccaceae bacterium]
MRTYAIAVYLFLYIPIGVIAIFSFNAGRHAAQFQGFSTQWYGKALSNPFVMEALQTSATVATVSAALATVAGTLAALALQGVTGRPRIIFDALIYVAVMVPGIVIGISTLIALVTLFDFLNPVLSALWPLAGAAPKLNLGTGTLIAAHGLFAMALVVIIVRARVSGMDRSLIEASADLGATPWGTFRQVTLPQIAPAILAGFLLSFTFSFDDFIIAFFVAGSETTLPIYVFSSIRRGVTPEINAIGTMVLAASLVVLIAAQAILQRGRRRET